MKASSSKIFLRYQRSFSAYETFLFKIVKIKVPAFVIENKLKLSNNIKTNNGKILL